MCACDGVFFPFAEKDCKGCVSEHQWVGGASKNLRRVIPYNKGVIDFESV